MSPSTAACQSSQRESAATSAVDASGASRLDAASVGRGFPRLGRFGSFLRPSGASASMCAWYPALVSGRASGVATTRVTADRAIELQACPPSRPALGPSGPAQRLRHHWRLQHPVGLQGDSRDSAADDRRADPLLVRRGRWAVGANALGVRRMRAAFLPGVSRHIATHCQRPLRLMNTSVLPCVSSRVKPSGRLVFH